MSIKLRERKLKDGRVSFFLDISHEGKRRYEFLDIHIKPGKGRKLSEDDKLKKETAEKIRSQKEYELIVQKKGLHNEIRSREDFLVYMENFGKAKKQRHIISASKRLKKFAGGVEFIPFNRITKTLLLDFQNYLLSKGYGQNSARQYMIAITMTLNQAVEDKIIPINPMKDIPKRDRIQRKEVSRSFLTIDDLKQLAKAETSASLEYRHAFLLSCFTGLRYSDLHRLRWTQLRELGEKGKGQWVIQYRMQKTTTVEVLPLSPEAINIIEQRRMALNDSTAEFLFPSLVYADGSKINNRHDTVNKALQQWAKDAEIEKYLHFHVARHTFATLAIASGTDLYVVSKLLGHRDLATTQVYAKIMDKTKHDAVNALPTLGIITPETVKKVKEKKVTKSKTKSKGK